MDEFFIGLYLCGGIALLYAGAESLIHGGASLALRIGLPLLVIGLTIMGYGTGTPELIVSIKATLDNKGDIVVGNVIGSNIANIGLILGFSAIWRPIAIKSQLARHDGPVMVLVTMLLCFLILINSNIGRWKGLVLFAGFLVYTGWTIYLGKKEKKLEKELEVGAQPLQFKSQTLELFMIAAGFILLFFGGNLFLEGATTLAAKFGISDAVIGLTVVAIGTSLPEFATSLVALHRKHEDIALGNIVGSNIFNILCIVGLASLINPINVVNINWIDYTYLVIISAFLWFIIRSQNRIRRWQGAAMLISYTAYLVYLALGKG